LDFKASATLIAPSTPVLLFHKLIGVKFKYNNKETKENTYLSSVKVLLDFNASATLIAPSAPTWLSDKLIIVNTNTNNSNNRNKRIHTQV
jgi:hypothetical protein